jgi:hypothetical protein
MPDDKGGKGGEPSSVSRNKAHGKRNERHEAELNAPRNGIHFVPVPQSDEHAAPAHRQQESHLPWYARSFAKLDPRRRARSTALRGMTARPSLLATGLSENGGFESRLPLNVETGSANGVLRVLSGDDRSASHDYVNAMSRAAATVPIQPTIAIAPASFASGGGVAA